MHCRSCDYPLWNLTTRQCPECGTHFAPSEFEFVPNSVRFCCPNCHQTYYGTGPKGHLEPAVFDCVTCGRGTEMDSMILLPAEGVEEKHTRAASNPWLERSRVGRIRGWLSTVGGALAAPIRLMRGTPVASPLGQAWWFAMVTVVVTLSISFIPATLVIFVMPWLFAGAGPGAPTPGVMAAAMGTSLVVAYVVIVVLLLAYAVVWGLATHGILRLSGPRPGPLRRTYQAICYASGAFVTTAIPCVGQYVGGIWWTVSAVLTVKEAHGVGGGRATFAVLAFPVLLVVLVVGLYVALIVHMVTGAAALGMTVPLTSPQQTQIVLDAVLAYAEEHEDRGPDHAVVLVTSGRLTGWDFVGEVTATDPDDIPVGDRNMGDFIFLPEEEQQVVAEASAADVPPGTIAHRVGDFVFTYHGIDLSAADAGLWIVVAVPDPEATPLRGRTNVIVGLADGTVTGIPASQLPSALDGQNALREENGLPPLPDPVQVKHGAPATTENAADDE